LSDGGNEILGLTQEQTAYPSRLLICLNTLLIGNPKTS
jgi:hypothetical protein